MKSLRGVAPMFPLSLGGLTPLQGRAIIDRQPLAPTIPVQFWAGTAPGIISTPANTPQYAPGTPAPIPGTPAFNTSIGGTSIGPTSIGPTSVGGSTFTVTLGGQTLTITIPGSGGAGGDCCG